MEHPVHIEYKNIQYFVEYNVADDTIDELLCPWILEKQFFMRETFAILFFDAF